MSMVKQHSCIVSMYPVAQTMYKRWKIEVRAPEDI